MLFEYNYYYPWCVQSGNETLYPHSSFKPDCDLSTEGCVHVCFIGLKIVWCIKLMSIACCINIYCML